MALITADIQPRSQVMAQRMIAWAGLRMPMDVEEAARRLGVDIVDIYLAGPVSGMLVREEPGRWLIIVNSRYGDPGRRRFTIAHELAHWTLHRPLLSECSLELRDEWEREADEFAAHLLMPPDQVQEWIHMFGLVDLERAFGVSKAAAATTLRRMGYRVWW